MAKADFSPQSSGPGGTNRESEKVRVSTPEYVRVVGSKVFMLPKPVPATPKK